MNYFCSTCWSGDVEGSCYDNQENQQEGQDREDSEGAEGQNPEGDHRSHNGRNSRLKVHQTQRITSVI